jgi:hypothetical protein
MDDTDKNKISNNQLFQEITFTWHNINARLPEKEKKSLISKLPCCKPSLMENKRNQIIDNGNLIIHLLNLKLFLI